MSHQTQPRSAPTARRSEEEVQLKQEAPLPPLSAPIQFNGRPPIQFAGAPDTSRVHEAAAEGLQGASTSLPHLDAIQHSFGGYDVSGVKAHVGGAAAQANAKMGSLAYATGENVAFKQSPDLHTAAHEAAHVVQQRAGVSLDGGVGQVGDSYEQHADAVADAVVQGKSAESLLSGVAGGGGGGGATQMKAVQFEGPGETCEEPTLFEELATNEELTSEEAQAGVWESKLKGLDPKLHAAIENAYSTGTATVANTIQNIFIDSFKVNILNPAIDQAVANLDDSLDPTLSEKVLQGALIKGLGVLTGGVGGAIGGEVAKAAAGAIASAGELGIKTAFESRPNKLALSDFKTKRKAAHNEPEKEMLTHFHASFKGASRDDCFRIAYDWKKNTKAGSSYATQAKNAYKDTAYDAWFEAFNQANNSSSDNNDPTTGRLTIRGHFGGKHFSDFKFWGIQAYMDGVDNTGGDRIRQRYAQRKLGDMAIQRDIQFVNVVASSLSGSLIWKAGGDVTHSLGGLQSIGQANYQDTNEQRALDLVKIWLSNQTLAGLNASISGDAPGAFD